MESDPLIKKDNSPSKKIDVDLTCHKADLLHASIGLRGEAGELVDAFKRYAIYNQELDRENVVEELGDLSFYTQAIINVLGFPRHCCARTAADYVNFYEDSFPQAPDGVISDETFISYIKEAPYVQEFAEYGEFVKTLLKPAQEIVDSMTDHKLQLFYGVTLVADVCNWIGTCISNYIILNQTLCEKRISFLIGVLELGMHLVRECVGISEQEVLDHNRAKLAERYENLKYSDQAAKDRKDKN